MYPFGNINVGTNPGDGTGDPLRVAFETINDNFANIAAGNITVTAPVTSVVGRTGNIYLTVNDIIGAVSTGALASDIANAQISGSSVNLSAFFGSYVGNISAGNVSATGVTANQFTFANGTPILSTIIQNQISNNTGSFIQFNNTTGDILMDVNGIQVANVAIAGPTGLLTVIGGIKATSGLSAQTANLASIGYTMGNSQNWTSSVFTVGDALDQLAQRLKASGH
jgi:hypothetical protein